MQIDEYEFEYVDIDSVEHIGYFEEEYVYDIEVSDNVKRTFFANNILVHNSIFLCFDEIYNLTDFEDNIIEFIKKLNELFLEEFFVKILDLYAKKFNSENHQLFELEKLARKAIFLGKKRYVLDIVWTMSGLSYKEGEKLTIKGVEIIRSDTPKFCKKHLKNMVNYILKESDNLDIENLVRMIKQLKKEYLLTDIEELSYGKSVNNYDKFILDDRKTLKLAKGTPINVSSSGVYNFLLNKNKKLKNKYHLIKSGDKIRYYYIKNNPNYNSFGFIPGEFPVEFAPDFNYDLMFIKTFIHPLNSFVEAILKRSIPDNLTIQKKLF